VSGYKNSILTVPIFEDVQFRVPDPEDPPDGTKIYSVDVTGERHVGDINITMNVIP
jgi:hypothetical protein